MSVIDEYKKIRKELVESSDIDIECPTCHHTFVGKVGLNICPSCGEEINVVFNPEE